MINKFCIQLEMLARLKAGQRDGHRHQADDDFRGWIENDCPVFRRLWNKVNEILGRCRGEGTLHSFQRCFLIVYVMFLAGDMAPKVAIEL